MDMFAAMESPFVPAPESSQVSDPIPETSGGEATQAQMLAEILKTLGKIEGMLCGNNNVQQPATQSPVLESLNLM